MPDAPDRPTQAQLDAHAARFNQAEAVRMFGVRVAFPEGRQVVATLDPVRSHHRGGAGTPAINGGVIAAVFDLVVGCTAALVDPSRRAATMQLSISFERPLLGDTVRAEAVIDTAGGSTVYASARMLDADGVVCARCQGLVKLLRGEWFAGQDVGA